LYLATEHVGFGSLNVIVYTGSQAGDTGRAEEVYFAWGLGLIGAVQLMYTGKLMLELSKEPMDRPGYGQTMEDVREYV